MAFASSNLQSDIQQYEQLWKNVKQYQMDLSNKQNRTQLKRSLIQMSELSHQIQEKIDSTYIPDENNPIQQQFLTINQEFTQNRGFLSEQLLIAEGSFDNHSEEPYEDNYCNQYDTQEDDEADEIEEIAQIANQLVSQMAELKRLSQETHEKIRQQHHILMRVDTVTSSTNTTMQNANQELEKAEEHQKRHWWQRKSKSKK